MNCKRFLGVILVFLLIIPSFSFSADTKFNNRSFFESLLLAAGSIGTGLVIGIMFQRHCAKSGINVLAINQKEHPLETDRAEITALNKQIAALRKQITDLRAATQELGQQKIHLEVSNKSLEARAEDIKAQIQKLTKAGEALPLVSVAPVVGLAVGLPANSQGQRLPDPLFDPLQQQLKGAVDVAREMGVSEVDMQGIVGAAKKAETARLKMRKDLLGPDK